MKYGRTFLASMVGGAVMSAISTPVWTMGIMDVNLSMMEGSIHSRADASTWHLDVE